MSITIEPITGGGFIAYRSNSQEELCVGWGISHELALVDLLRKDGCKSADEAILAMRHCPYWNGEKTLGHDD